LKGYKGSRKSAKYYAKMEEKYLLSIRPIKMSHYDFIGRLKYPPPPVIYKYYLPKIKSAFELYRIQPQKYRRPRQQQSIRHYSPAPRHEPRAEPRKDISEMIRDVETRLRQELTDRLLRRLEAELLTERINSNDIEPINDLESISDSDEKTERSEAENEAENKADEAEVIDGNVENKTESAAADMETKTDSGPVPDGGAVEGDGQWFEVNGMRMQWLTEDEAEELEREIAELEWDRVMDHERDDELLEMSEGVEGIETAGEPEIAVAQTEFMEQPEGLDVETTPEIGASEASIETEALEPEIEGIGQGYRSKMNGSEVEAGW